ncbi:MAG: hypothetical protein AAF645_26315, partial [Myxococcota bacterium]
AFMNNGIYRYEDDAFTLEAADVFADSVRENLYWPWRHALFEGDGSGHVYAYAAVRGEVANAVYARRDGVWDWTEALPLDEFEPTDMHVEADGRLWLTGTGPRDSEFTRVWSLDEGRWSVEDLAQSSVESSFETMRYIDGRDDRLWIVAADRRIWRRVDGEWQRDDRCFASERFGNQRFERLWFPPDGPPKVFVSGGTILEWRELPQ